MADKIRMDSHKLMFHPAVVNRWQTGKLIYPIEMEIGLSGACNHRCIFCAVDYMDYQPRLLKADILLPNLQAAAAKGLKSVIYAGEGEPLVNKEAAVIINSTKDYGIDTAISTNGVLMTPEFSKACLQSLSWVRISIAGATAATYEHIHNAAKGDLQKALSNIQAAREIKQKNKLATTLGAQLLLLPENKDEVVMLGKLLREIGVDYFTVKPFSQHPKSKAKLQVDYSESQSIAVELKELETEQFKIYFRQQSIESLAHEKPYDVCSGLAFMAYMDAQGNVFPCIVFMGEDKYRYGNIHDKSLAQLWESDTAILLRKIFQGEFLKKNCRKNCRLDEINKYLHELKHPGQHVNFI